MCLSHFFKTRRWAHTPEKGTWLWILQICMQKTWCPSQWYVPILDGHLSWDSPQMSENPHPALRHINRYLKNTRAYCPVYILFCSGGLWSIFQIFHKMQVAQIKQLSGKSSSNKIGMSQNRGAPNLVFSYLKFSFGALLFWLHPQM